MTQQITWQTTYTVSSERLNSSIPELAYRCAKFITICLNSNNCVIRLVARHGVFQRMCSPVGRNAQHCSSQFGVTVNQLANINKQVAYSYQYNAIWLSGIDVSTVTQLLDVKHNYACLPLSSSDEIDFMIEYLCTN